MFCYVVVLFSLSFSVTFFLSLSVNLVQYPITCGGTRELSYLCTSELCSDWVELDFGNRLMGKVASDKCHKWVFKEPTECEPNISNYWQSSFDAVCVHILNSLPPHPFTLLLLFLFCLFIIYKSKY